MNFNIIFIIFTSIGILIILLDSFRELRQGRYSLDYIALLAMVVSLISHEYIAGTIVALMFTGGKGLEVYANRKAEASLKALLNRIPKSAMVTDGTTTREVPLQEIHSDEIIIVRPNELIPLDGILLSKKGIFNESNLTGEALPVERLCNTFIKSGVVNTGETIELRVVGTFTTSTYTKIINLVSQAREHEAPLVRVAARANIIFTVITLIIAGTAFAVTHDIVRLLAVLVIATPCPLIIAAPIAFIGGMSRAARKNIIVKSPKLLETLARANVVFFDKTGTLTLGEPVLSTINLRETTMNPDEILQVIASIEFHSIHPIARALVKEAQARKITMLEASEVVEIIGKGISGIVNETHYTIAQTVLDHQEGIHLSLSSKEILLSVISLADQLKPDAAQILQSMTSAHLKIAIITGDTLENAKSIFKNLPVEIHADCSPEDKYHIIDTAKKDGNIVVMVGDGLNDAPALARAHAGIVFSGTENSAAIEAADGVILGSDLAKVSELFAISKRSLRIAQESIWAGIILSVTGMTIAAFGFIPPIIGAFVQEAIDVSVILNSLRSIIRPYRSTT